MKEIRKHRQTFIYLVPFVLLMIAVAVLLLRGFISKHPPTQLHKEMPLQVEEVVKQPQSPSDKQPDVVAVTAQPSSENMDDIHLEVLPDLPMPHNTVSELINKGFPLMSNPRKAAYEQTAGQPIPELIADLGNIFVIIYCHNQNFAGSPDDICTWSNDITTNLKVLRLIEEGRKNPDQIAPLLEAAISDCLQGYDVLHNLWREWMGLASGTVVTDSISELDPYYNKFNKYKNPLSEMNRVHYVVYSSFYVLANIDRLKAPQLLADWIQKKKPRRINCPDMDAWLIDCYFNLSNTDDSVFAGKHRELTKDEQLSGAHRKMSRWNALWDIHHPLLAARNVDVSDIQTIKVLDIPQRLPVEDLVVEQIISNFLEYATQAK